MNLANRGGTHGSPLTAPSGTIHVYQEDTHESLGTIYVYPLGDSGSAFGADKIENMKLWGGVGHFTPPADTSIEKYFLKFEHPNVFFVNRKGNSESENCRTKKLNMLLKFQNYNFEILKTKIEKCFFEI